MKQNWTLDELIDTWLVKGQDLAFVQRHKTPTNQLVVALLLKYFQTTGRFPYRRRDIPRAAIDFISRQLQIEAILLDKYSWRGRTIKYHRRTIRDYLGFREGTVADGERMAEWLVNNVVADESKVDRLMAAVYERYRQEKIEPPTAGRVERIVRSAQRRYSDRFCIEIAAKLPSETKAALDQLLKREPDDQGHIAGYSPFARLKRDAGNVSLKSIKKEAAKLTTIHAVQLPTDLFDNIPAHIIELFRSRVAVERPREVLRHPKPRRYTMLAAFCYLRGREIIDNLVELFINIIKKIEKNAENTMLKQLLEEVHRVQGKKRLLVDIARASVADPDQTVRDTIYPVADPDTLQHIIDEWESEHGYEVELRRVARQSYARHYRRMVPPLLQSLQIQSDTDPLQPLMQAVALIQRYVGTGYTYYPDEESVPLVDVVPAAWQPLVVQHNGSGQQRINRISYELCIFQALREQLRCRAAYVDGANRFRNPKDDLPQDFDEKKDDYYAALQQPQDAKTFVNQLRQQMADALHMLDRGFNDNQWLAIDEHRKHPLRLTPLPAQDDPVHIRLLKQAIQERWSQTPLLDMLKETEMRVGLTDHFHTSGSDVRMDEETQRRNLLLCLYALGTNAGYKRMGGVSSDALRHMRRRYVTKQNLRAAIGAVVNATLAERAPYIWGEATTACAADSKKFAAWDQNLLTEWHIRYRGPGIMVYWHIDKKAACIHSQVKRCSSSEVAAMIEGVLHHCTEMSVDKNYVDTHGQSSVAFAFCHLLGFDLLPRLQPMSRQKLYKPYRTNDEFTNLTPILTRPIRWELIAEHYDEMVRYATALRLGTAEAEAILQRFTKHGVQHPTYKALVELGKAKKSIFLCRYLSSLELRREIHEGLNVVENWNSANGFIYFARGSEIRTNDRESQEISVLALHLLQASMVYINTLMIQRVLREPEWENRLLPEDLRALTPLIYDHVNPYGHFDLDLGTRLQLD